MKNLLILLTNKFLLWLTKPKYNKEIVVPISRQGFLEVVGFLQKFIQDGLVIPHKLLIIDFKKGEYIDKLVFKIEENQV